MSKVVAPSGGWKRYVRRTGHRKPVPQSSRTPFEVFTIGCAPTDVRAEYNPFVLAHP